MPKSFGRTVDAVFTLAVSLVASACFAEMIVTTHDGRRLTLPVKSSELKGIEFSDGAAPASRYWKLSGVTIDRSRLTRALSEPGGETALSFPCTSENSCEATQTFRGQTHLRARFRWTKPPESLSPDTVLPVEFNAEVVESRVGPGGMSVYLAQRFAPGTAGHGGWEEMVAVNNGQSSGSVSRRANGGHKTIPGRKGDKAVYEVFVSAGSAGQLVFQYAYDWVE